MTNKGGVLVNIIKSNIIVTTFLGNVLKQLVSTFSLSIFSTSHTLTTLISKRQLGDTCLLANTSCASTQSPDLTDLRAVKAEPGPLDPHIGLIS